MAEHGDIAFLRKYFCFRACTSALDVRITFREALQHFQGFHDSSSSFFSPSLCARVAESVVAEGRCSWGAGCRFGGIGDVVLGRFGGLGDVVVFRHRGKLSGKVVLARFCGGIGDVVVRRRRGRLCSTSSWAPFVAAGVSSSGMPRILAKRRRMRSSQASRERSSTVGICELLEDATTRGCLGSPRGI